MSGPWQRLRKTAHWLDRRLSRVTRGEYIAEVDGIRFTAIAAVIVFHSLITLNWLRGTYQPNWSLNHGLLVQLIGLGFFGVEIFFVLSGFVVTLPFARHAILGTPAPDLKRYYLRRLTRIEPPYFLVLTISWLIDANRTQLTPHFLAGLIYSHGYIFGASNPLALFAWSLEVEIAFYIVAPWLARIYLVRPKYLRWTVQALLLLGACHVSTFEFTEQLRPRLTVVQMSPYFLAGMLLADWYASGMLRRTASLAWDLAAAAGLGALMYTVGVSIRAVWTWYWLAPLMILVLFVGIFKGLILNRLLRLRPITLIGGMCYTLYLWHGLIFSHLPYRLVNHIARLPYERGVMVCCIFALPLAILAAAPIYLLTEKPFMNGPGTRFLERRFRSLFQAVRSRKPEASEATA